MNERPPRSPPLRGPARVAAVAGSLYGGTGIALAAVSAHLGGSIGDAHRQAMFREGVEMQVWHALALLATAALLRDGGRLAAIAVAGFVIGTPLFAVGVDLLALDWLPATGRLAPTGGSILILSWLVLAAALARAR